MNKSSIFYLFKHFQLSFPSSHAKSHKKERIFFDHWQQWCENKLHSQVSAYCIVKGQIMVCCLQLTSARAGLTKKKKIVSSLGLNNSLVESLNTSQILSCIHRFPVILLLTIKFKTKPNKNIPRLLLKKQEFDKKPFVVSENLHHIEDDCCVHSSIFYGSWNRFLLCILNNFSVFYLEFFNQVWATGNSEKLFSLPMFSSWNQSDGVITSSNSVLWQK